MKALTLTQPWATLVALGKKTIETRSWPTRYRGPVLIHAAKNFPLDCREACIDWPFLDALHPLHADILPLGVVVARAYLFDCLPTEEILRLNGDDETFCDGEEWFGDYSDGRYAFVLKDIVPVDNVPVKGALGLWTPSPELIAKVEAHAHAV